MSQNYPFGFEFDYIIHPSGTAVGADYSSIGTAFAAQTAAGVRWLVAYGSYTEAADIVVNSTQVVYWQMPTVTMASDKTVLISNKQDVKWVGGLKLVGPGDSADSYKLFDANNAANDNVDLGDCNIEISFTFAGAAASDVYPVIVDGNFCKWKFWAAAHTINANANSIYFIRAGAGYSSHVDLTVYNLVNSHGAAVGKVDAVYLGGYEYSTALCRVFTVTHSGGGNAYGVEYASCNYPVIYGSVQGAGTADLQAGAGNTGVNVAAVAT